MDIAKQIKETEYGDVNVIVTTHRGVPVGLVTSSFRHDKFHGGQNTEALETILTTFKNMVDTKQTGSFTFTVVFNEGEVKEIINQYYDKKTYQLDVEHKGL